MKNLSFFRQSGVVLHMLLGSFCTLQAMASTPLPNTRHGYGPPTYVAATNDKRPQQQQISGIISDQNGPLPGVTISVKNGTAVAITDESGYYTITASINDTLILSYIGYKTLEILVKSPTVNAILNEDAATLQEVTVNAGYYTVKEKERTGSIATIKAADIEKQPVTNVLGALQGRMAGVDITQETGLPGGGFDIRIRGLNSLRSGGNAPLYIIDGVPFASDAIGDGLTATTFPVTTSPLNTINPNDIESIDILKDADATAIYGSRGANGVVLITTKKGVYGKTLFSVAATTGAGTVTRMMNLLNTEQYLIIRQQAFANDGIVEYPSNAYDVNGTWDPLRYTDWQKELIGGTAEIRTLQASLSGGSETTNFFVSANTYSQGTVFPGDFNYKKGGGHASINHRSADSKFRMLFSATYDVQSNNQPASDLTRISRNLAPNAPALYTEDGELNWENSTWENPLAALNAKALANTNSLVANSTLSYVLPLGITARASMGFTDLYHKESRAIPFTIYDPIYEATSQLSTIYLNNTNRRSWIVEPQISWKNETNRNIVDVLVGTTFQNQVNNKQVQIARGFTSNHLMYDLSSASLIRTLQNNETEYKYQALFGRVNFSHNQRYFLNLTGRRDGSSRFGPGKQFSNFGAVGGAWLFSESEWMKKRLSFLSQGKIRSSYGITGNDQIGDYQFLDTYQSSGVDYNGSMGLEPIRLFNPNFSWETNKKLEVAAELGFLRDRISIAASYYKNRSSNQLVGIPLPATTGFSSINGNLGATVENSGIELTSRTINVKSKNFDWSSNFNISIPKNKLIAFPGLETSTYQNQYIIGESISIRKVYNFTGINPQTGIYEFEDVNNDGIISSIDDAKIVKDFSPSYFGGLLNHFRYKNIELDFLFQFVKQLNWNALTQYSAAGSFGNQPVAVLGGWQQIGDSAANQIYTTGANGDAMTAAERYATSDAAISDASFIRLKNISISYKVPQLKGIQCRLYLQAQNLITFTSYKDADPEFRSMNFLPPLRILSFGTEIKF